MRTKEGTPVKKSMRLALTAILLVSAASGLMAAPINPAPMPQVASAPINPAPMPQVARAPINPAPMPQLARAPINPAPMPQVC